MARILFTLEDGTELDAELSAGVLSIGRHPDNSIVLQCASVSSHHATITVREDGIYLQDLGATNGTKLNGVEVEQAKLGDGDRLSFGDVPAVLQLAAPPEAVQAFVPTPPQPSVVVQPVAKHAGRPAPGRPAGRPGAPRRPGVGRARSTATYRQSSGCAGFIAMLVFLTFAFVAGLFIRHYVQYDGRFLLTDAVQIFRDKVLGIDSVSPAAAVEGDAKATSGTGSKSSKK
jgi:hypothetical protein